MKPIKSSCLSLLIVIGAAAVVRSAPFRTDINPAMQYYQAFQVAPDLSQADRDYLFENEWRGQKLPGRFGELVARYDNQFKLVRQAVLATVPCDWGIDMSPGPATLLPHLARSKAIAQAGRLRVLWDLQNGQQAEARDDLLAAFAMGRNSSRDGTLISALVQVAMENIVCSIMAENFYQFSPETLKQLADGFDAAPARRTMADCVPAEKAFFLDWLMGKILELQKENPGNEPRVMAGVHEVLAFMDVPGEGQTNQAPPNGREQVIKAAGGTSEGVLKLLRDLEPLYERLAVILALPQPEYKARVKSFAAEVENSHNPLVALSFPAFEKCRQKEFVILVKLSMVRAEENRSLVAEFRSTLSNWLHRAGCSDFRSLSSSVEERAGVRSRSLQLILKRLALPALGAAVVAIATWSLFMRRPTIPLLAPIVPEAVLSPHEKSDLDPTVSNYRMVANRSLEKLDELLTRQGNRNPSPAPIHTASARARANSAD